MKDRKLKFSVCVGKKKFVKPHKISTHSAHQTCFISMVVWLSWNFVRFHKIFFQTVLKVSAFYLEKQKSFIPKKIFKPLSIWKQKDLFTDPIFRQGFDFYYVCRATHAFSYTLQQNRLGTYLLPNSQFLIWKNWNFF